MFLLMRKTTQRTDQLSVLETDFAASSYVTDDSWFETRSELYSAVRLVNSYFNKLVLNLLELREKQDAVLIRYIGTWNGVQWPYQGFETQVSQHFFWSESLVVVFMTVRIIESPAKKKTYIYALQFLAIAVKAEHICFMSHQHMESGICPSQVRTDNRAWSFVCVRLVA